MPVSFVKLTLRITGSKKQSDEGAPLFAVRVHAIVGRSRYAADGSGSVLFVHD